MSSGKTVENQSDIPVESSSGRASVRLVGESIGLAVVLLLSLSVVVGDRAGLIPFGEYLSSLILLLGSLIYLKLFRAGAIPERLVGSAVRPAVGVSKLNLAILACGLTLLALAAWIPLAPQRVTKPDPRVAFHLLLLVPISEELYFRGLLLSHLQRGFGTMWAVALSSIFFMLLHHSVGAIIVAGGLAVVACLLVLKSGSLWLAVQLHVIWNGLTYISRIDDDSVRWGYAGVTGVIIAALFAANVVFSTQGNRYD